MSFGQHKFQPQPGETQQQAMARVMAWQDQLPAKLRELINEYGLVIIDQMIADREGEFDFDELEFTLMTRRWRDQEAWLKTTYINPAKWTMPAARAMAPARRRRLARLEWRRRMMEGARDAG